MLVRTFVTLLLSSIFFFPATSEAKKSPEQTYAELSGQNEAELEEHGHYTNKRGNLVHSPAHSKSGAIPNGATAQCRDDSYSFSQSRRGTCSRHGGVGQWLN
jgi:hypothetical protein